MASDRDERIRELFPLVRRMARRIHAAVPGAEIDDLIGDGSVGLIRAVDQFDPERGPTLEHYARHLIAGAMLNGLRRMDPVSERSRRIARDGDNYRYALAVERGRVPTLAEIDRIRPAYKRACAATHFGTPLSLDAPLPDGESIDRDWSRDPANLVLARHYRAYVERLIDGLPKRQRMLMRGHYFGERSLRDVGQLMGISPQRASQLHVAAIKRLRRAACASPY